MRYMSKEWAEWLPYNGKGLYASEKAAVFSEDYFRRTYRRKLRARKKWEWKYSKEGIELEWPKQPEALPEGYASMAEYEAARLEELGDYEYSPYDEAAVERQFEVCHREQMECLKDYLPQEILAQVADLRVLALDIATPEIKMQIEAYDAWVEAEQDAATFAHEHEYEAMMQRHPDCFAAKLCFHDWKLKELRQEGNDLFLCMEYPYDEEVPRAHIRFRNCEIEEMDVPLDANWINSAVWEHEEGYEVRVWFDFLEEGRFRRDARWLILYAEDGEVS